MTIGSSPAACSDGVLQASNLVDLAGILNPEVNIAIWSRPADPRILSLLTLPQWSADRCSRLTTHSDEPRLEQRIRGLLPEECGEIEPEGVDALVADVHGLSEAFADLLLANELMISLEDPEVATCPRFHVDRVGVRMLVTYCGVGTEYLLNSQIDRRWLGFAGMECPDPNAAVMRPGAQIQRVPESAVVLLKGEAWPGAKGFGAVHRSPDPEGKPRTLLRVDMLSQRPIVAGAPTGTPEES